MTSQTLREARKYEEASEKLIKEEEKPAEPKKSAEVLLLEEIRDLLKEENKPKTNKKKKGN